MTFDHLRDLTMAALVARTFGRDALALLRRAAAAGVRAGVSEIHNRADREHLGGRL